MFDWWDRIWYVYLKISYSLGYDMHILGYDFQWDMISLDIYILWTWYFKVAYSIRYVVLYLYLIYEIKKICNIYYFQCLK